MYIPVFIHLFIILLLGAPCVWERVYKERKEEVGRDKMLTVRCRISWIYQALTQRQGSAPSPPEKHMFCGHWNRLMNSTL